MPSREQRRRQIRAVPVLPVAADELRARRDDARLLGGVPTGGRDDDHARLQPRHVHELAANLDAQVLRRVDLQPQPPSRAAPPARSPLEIVPSKATFPEALPTRAATCVEPRRPVRVRSGAGTRWRFAAGWVAVGGVGELLSLAFQAEMITTMTIAIAASATSTTFVSIRRCRRCGRAAERRVRGS